MPMEGEERRQSVLSWREKERGQICCVVLGILVLRKGGSSFPLYFLPCNQRERERVFFFSPFHFPFPWLLCSFFFQNLRQSVPSFPPSTLAGSRPSERASEVAATAEGTLDFTSSVLLGPSSVGGGQFFEMSKHKQPPPLSGRKKEEERDDDENVGMET